MITSQARIILTAAGGDEKRVKLEISLLAPKTTYRSTVDAKGAASWIVDTVSLKQPLFLEVEDWCITQRDKHFVFEEPKNGSPSATSSTTSIQEWIDTLDRAKELAMSQQSSTYSGDEYRDLSSGFSSQANTLDHSSELQTEVQPSMRATLRKNSGGDNDSLKGKKRFSKRHSKNGLAAVF